jgi:folate-binding protein YgfZ
MIKVMFNYYRLQQDYLKFTGKDKLDLIHRLSTNDVNSLSKYHIIKTILTTDKGRFVDLLTLFNFGEFIFASCSKDNGERVISHFDKYTIMDDFHVENMPGTHETIIFFGDKTDKFINEVFGFRLIEQNIFKIYAEDGKDSILLKNDNPLGGATLVYSVMDKDYYENKIFNCEISKKYDLTELSDSDYQTLRILHGIPEQGKEMTEETNPLECGLNKYVSFSKGCYIGQEVIARLDTYDKVNKHIVGIKASSELLYVHESSIITVPGENECGFISSYANSEKYGHIGLGFVKTTFLNYKNDYKITTKNGSIGCKLVKLPFTNLN